MPSKHLSSILVARGVLLLIALLVVARPARSEESSAARHVGLRGWFQLDGAFSDHRVHFGLQVKRDGGTSNWGRTMPIEALQGLTAAALDRDGEVSFRVVRDAGAFECRGAVYGGRGQGKFELVLNPDYARELGRRGVGRPSEEQQVELALADASLGFLDALKQHGYPTPTVDRLTTLANHGVHEEYVRGMAEAGLRFGSLSELQEARDHGVDPAFVRGMAEAGYKDLDFERLRTARDHGVDAEYLRGMRKIVGELSLEEMIQLRDHGLDPGYVAAMHELFARASWRQLLAARDHGVDVQYARSLASTGYPDPTLAMVVQARDHGVSAADVRRAKERLGKDVSLAEVIDWRDRGGR